ncbi:MBL fold metallo-hydrolase [Minwuia sp.]|uniref:MBL fold metallo-hydrolase n=1 Tax=Minwuia sp. TaxID=2493630 RepID=UPI003A9150A3
MPQPDRAGPATLVRVAGKDFLFDCGRGVLMRAMSVDMTAPGLTAQFLTHLHSDHTTDFNDVITTRWIMSPQPNPLQVHGPVGTRKFTDATLAALDQDIGYRIAHHDDLTEPPAVAVFEHGDGLVLEEDGVRITCAPTDHSPVHPTLGYRIEFGGKAVAIAGDTVPCEGLDRICKNADVYVQTVIRSDIIANARGRRIRDVIDYHSDVKQAGETAARNDVRKLVLNHFVPPPPPGREEEWAADARDVFDGEILVSHDLMQIGTG